ncbi:MAG: O-antigen ligase family protein [Bacillota bacterium]
MNKKNWLKAAVVCYYLAALALPWQTKLIVLAAPSDYWEISIYAAWVFVWLALLLGLPSGLFSGNLKWNPLTITASVLSLAGLASATFSSAPYLSFYYLLLSLSGMAFFVSIRKLAVPVKRNMAVLALSSLTAQAAIGIWQFVTQLSFSSTLLGIAYHNAGNLGTAVIEVSDGRWLRAYGASSHPNAFGGLMAIGAIGILYLFIREKKAVRRLLAGSVFLLFFAGAIVSFSRAAWLALFCATAVLIWENRRVLLERWKGFAVLFVFSLLVAAGLFFSYQPLFLVRTQAQGRLEEMSFSDRREYDARGWHDFLRDPLSGTGLAASTLADRQRDEAAGKNLPVWSYQPAHDYWLLAGTEAGIFFLLALGAIWIMAIKKSWTNQLLALPTALFFLSLFDHWLFSLPLAPAWVAFLFALMW